jgi:hypothetical protein
MILACRSDRGTQFAFHLVDANVAHVFIAAEERPVHKLRIG